MGPLAYFLRYVFVQKYTRITYKTTIEEKMRRKVLEVFLWAKRRRAGLLGTVERRMPGPERP
jgi:hypothetical protein